MASSKAGTFALGLESRFPFVPMLIVFVLALFAVGTSHKCIGKIQVFELCSLEQILAFLTPGVSRTSGFLVLL